jgi:hypothetical protein
VHYAPLRAVAWFYALLGVLAVACAVVIVGLSPYVGGGVRAQSTPLTIYIVLAVTFWVLAWLSLRYLVLSSGWQAFAIAASILLALLGLSGAVQVTLTGRANLGWMALIPIWWGLAFAFSLCSSVLWRQRRASNNRWRGP